CHPPSHFVRCRVKLRDRLPTTRQRALSSSHSGDFQKRLRQMSERRLSNQQGRKSARLLLRRSRDSIHFSKKPICPLVVRTSPLHRCQAVKLFINTPYEDTPLPISLLNRFTRSGRAKLLAFTSRWRASFSKSGLREPFRSSLLF